MDRAKAEPAGRARRAALVAVQLLVTGVVAWYILDRVGLSMAELGAVDLRRWIPRWGWLVASCLLLGAGYALSGVIWGVMVREMGGGRVPRRSAVRIFLVANLGRYIPGKLWQIASLALLARDEDVPPRVATGAAVLGQGIALAAASAVGLVTLLEAGGWYREAGVWIAVAMVVVGAGALTPPVLARVVDLWFRLARTEAPDELGIGPLRVLRWGGLYLVNWIVYALAFWIFVKSFDLPGTLLETAPAFAAAYVLGYVAVFAPAGIGVREGFLTAFLGPVMGVAPAATLSVLTRLWTTGVEVLPAGGLWVGRLVGGARDSSRGGMG